MKEKIIRLENGDVHGFFINLGKAPLIVIKNDKGYIMCGYLNMDTANKLGDIAGIVTGVKTFDDVLNSKIVKISKEAKKKGLKIDMTAKDFLNKLLEG